MVLAAINEEWFGGDEFFKASLYVWYIQYCAQCSCGQVYFSFFNRHSATVNIIKKEAKRTDPCGHQELIKHFADITRL